MALDINDLKAHCNVTGSADDVVLARLLGAATAHVGRLLGYAIDDAEIFPDGTPGDLELAVLQLAADWHENREATITGTIITAIPFGVQQIVTEYRTYTFSAADEA